MEDEKQDTLESRRAGNPLGRAAKNVGAGAVGIGLLLAKFKGLLLILLNLKFFALGWTFLFSLWLYVVVFGWRFAIVIMLLLLAHEFGHYAAFRAYGLPVRLPQFVPFLGAFTAGAIPQDPEHDAYISLAGPLTGLGLAAACYAIGGVSQDTFWIAIANVSAFLNLFNMIPLPPFDGGRVASVAIKTAGGTRIRVVLSYLGTLAGLIYILSISHVSVPSGRAF